jgi:hypothetical protein
MLIQDDEFRVYPEEGPMLRALEAPFSLVLPMVEDRSAVRASRKKTSTNDVERSSRVVAPQKSNRPHTLGKVLRSAVVSEAPALPQPRAREVMGRRSPSSSGVVVSVLLLSLSKEEG